MKSEDNNWTGCVLVVGISNEWDFGWLGKPARFSFQFVFSPAADRF